MKLTQEIKRMLDAFAYADASDNLTPRQKHQLLSGEPDATIPTPAAPASLTEAAKTSPGKTQVALFVGSEIPEAVMDYVLQTCSQLHYGLTILTLKSEQAARQLLAPYAPALQVAGLEPRMLTLHGEPWRALSKGLRQHGEIAFLVCKESGYLGQALIGNPQIQNNLPVPVVMVAEGQSTSAAATPDQQVRAAG